MPKGIAPGGLVFGRNATRIATTLVTPAEFGLTVRYPPGTR